MREDCPFCGLNVDTACDCEKRKLRSNMIDSSIFLGAYEESKYSGDCKLLLDGAREGVIAGLKARLSRWDELWDFYKFLPGEAKEQDRVYARKVVDMLKSLSY